MTVWSLEWSTTSCVADEEKHVDTVAAAAISSSSSEFFYVGNWHQDSDCNVQLIWASCCIRLGQTGTGRRAQAQQFLIAPIQLHLRQAAYEISSCTLSGIQGAIVYMNWGSRVWILKAEQFVAEDFTATNLAAVSRNCRCPLVAEEGKYLLLLMHEGTVLLSRSTAPPLGIFSRSEVAVWYCFLSTIMESRQGRVCTIQYIKRFPLDRADACAKVSNFDFKVRSEQSRLLIQILLQTCR